jgi:hypothetical protein
MKKKILIWGLGLAVGLPTVGFLVLKWGVLPPEKLTPRVQQGVGDLLNGRLECEKVELTFWETYPRLGVRVTGGCLLSYALGGVDTLLTFDRGVLSLSLPDYLWRDKIVVHRAALSKPRFYGKVDSCGKANWDIMKDDGGMEIPISVQRVRIREGYARYEDFADGLFAEMEDISLRCGDGLSQAGGGSLRVEAGTKVKAFDNGAYALEKPLALQLAGEIAWTDDFGQWTFRNGELRAGKLPFAWEGSLVTEEGGGQRFDVRAALKASHLADLLEWAPPVMRIDEWEAAGEVCLEADIRGTLGDSVMPAIDLVCRLTDGSLSKKGLKQGIDSLSLDASVHINGLAPDSSCAEISHLRLHGLDTSLDFTARITSLLRSPAVEIALRGDINFSRFSEEFIHPDSLRLQGRVAADLTAAFSVADLAAGRYDRIAAGGYLSLDSLRAFSRPYATDAFVSGVRLRIDSSANNVLQATILIDSLFLRYADAIDTRLTRFSGTARTTPLRDPSAVTPLSAHFHADFLRTRLPDSARLSARQADITAEVRPSVSNRRRPAFSAALAVDTVRYFALPVRSGLSFADLKLSLAPRSPVRSADTAAVRRRRIGRFVPDSVRRRTPPASSSTSLAALWQLGGTLSFSSARLFSRYYPLPLCMEATTVAFNANAVNFSGAPLHVGSSLFTITGEALNLRRAFLRGDTLRGVLTVESDHIDCNQLVSAAARGLQYADAQAALADPSNGGLTDKGVETDALLEENLSEMAVESLPALADTTPAFFVVPPRLDLTLHLHARKVDYKDLLLHDVVGEVCLHNQRICLKKLEIDSNMGKGKLTLFYAARDRHGATAGLDLDIDGVLVERLLHLYPPIDSLLPMLRSFEGILDGRLTALCEIDSTGAVDMGSLNCLALLSGRNLVLLDGETFAEISKTLMFKNKKRNVIDHLSVDVSIRDRRIEIFPFLLEIDRYRVAVGGTHNLDRSFNYHISVLHSPVPFKLGIDVNGTIERPRYKVTKCRYKNTFDPAREQPLIDTKLNLHTALLDILRRQTD